MSRSVTFRSQGDEALTLRGDASGQGPETVVLAHGGGQTRHAWRAAGDRLAALGYRVVRYDLRGHGDSDWSPRGGYQIDDHADDMDAVLAALHGPVTIVGASLGGLAALAAQGRRAGRPARAVALIDITLRPAISGTARVRDFLYAHPEGFGSVEEAADAVAAYHPERPRPKTTDGLRRNLRERADGRLRWHWDPRFIPDEQAMEIREQRLIALSPGVDAPVLLLKGGKSDMVDQAGMDQMQALLPDLRVMDVQGASHMISGDSNDAFLGPIVAFLGQVMPAGRPNVVG